LTKKDEKIKELESLSEMKTQEKQKDENKAHEAESIMKSFYSIDRFDTNFTSDVAMYLKKNNNEDSFVRSMKQPKN